MKMISKIILLYAERYQKKFETIYRGNAEALKIQILPENIKGEITIV